MTALTPNRRDQGIRMRVFGDDIDTVIRAGLHLGEHVDMGPVGVIRPDDDGGYHSELTMFLPDRLPPDGDR